MRRRFLRSTVASALLGASALSAPIAHACPNCKEAVAAQGSDGLQPEDTGARIADGYNRSVLLMVAMPFVLLGTGGVLVARAVKRGTLPEL
jgi:hypothetical protein